MSFKASLCTRERGKDRRRKWLAFRSQRCAAWSAEKVWILARLADAATSHSGAFGSYVRSHLASTTVLAQLLQRHPTNPLLKKKNEFMPASWTPCRWKVLQHFLGVVLSGLSFTYSVTLERGLPVSFFPSLKLVCVRLMDKTVNLIHRLQRADQSQVLRDLPKKYDNPKAIGARVYSHLRRETDRQP